MSRLEGEDGLLVGRKLGLSESIAVFLTCCSFLGRAGCREYMIRWVVVEQVSNSWDVRIRGFGGLCLPGTLKSCFYVKNALLVWRSFTTRWPCRSP